MTHIKDLESRITRLDALAMKMADHCDESCVHKDLILLSQEYQQIMATAAHKLDALYDRYKMYQALNQ